MNSLQKPKELIPLCKTKAERSYPTAKQATSKYKTQEQFKKKVQFDITEPPKNDLTHNNMVPFLEVRFGDVIAIEPTEFLLD